MKASDTHSNDVSVIRATDGLDLNDLWRVLSWTPRALCNFCRPVKHGAYLSFSKCFLRKILLSEKWTFIKGNLKHLNSISNSHLPPVAGTFSPSSPKKPCPVTKLQVSALTLVLLPKHTNRTTLGRREVSAFTIFKVPESQPFPLKFWIISFLSLQPLWKKCFERTLELHSFLLVTVLKERSDSADLDF